MNNLCGVWFLLGQFKVPKLRQVKSLFRVAMAFFGEYICEFYNSDLFGKMLYNMLYTLCFL